MNMCTIYFYEYIWKIRLVDIEIHEVIITKGVFLLIEILPITKK
jgi:hypothetical protein